LIGQKRLILVFIKDVAACWFYRFSHLIKCQSIEYKLLAKVIGYIVQNAQGRGGYLIIGGVLDGPIKKLR
jgi:hypothetical protein